MPDQKMYLIVKRGMYYRPDRCGYTHNVESAGRYTLEEAIRETHPNGPRGPRDGMSYVEAPEVAAPSLPEVSTESIIKAAIEEYFLDHATEDEGERAGRRAAIRGMMVRLDLYAELTAGIEEIHDRGIDTWDTPEQGATFFRSASRRRLTPEDGEAGHIRPTSDEDFDPSP